MRIRARTSRATQVLTVDETKSPEEFLKEIQAIPELFSGDETISRILKGFPPKPVEFEGVSQIKESIQNGDQLTIEVTKDKGSTSSPSKPVSNTASSSNDIPSVYIPELKQQLILRNIPDDNSCMFNAIEYAIKKESVPELRSICASYILSDKEKYNELVLGRTNEAYCEWITKKDSWGGAIELGIISDYYNVKFNCIDVELGNFIRFESGNPTSFVNLIYSGVHYDILSLNPKLSTTDTDKAQDTSIWNIGLNEEPYIMEASAKICKLLQTKNYTTNTTKFRIRCLECYKILVGETGAAKHSNETGHYKFGEV